MSNPSSMNKGLLPPYCYAMVAPTTILNDHQVLSNDCQVPPQLELRLDLIDFYYFCPWFAVLQTSLPQWSAKLTYLPLFPYLEHPSLYLTIWCRSGHQTATCQFTLVSRLCPVTRNTSVLLWALPVKKLGSVFVSLENSVIRKWTWRDRGMWKEERLHTADHHLCKYYTLQKYSVCM